MIVVRCIKSDPIGLISVGDFYEIESISENRWSWEIRRRDNHEFVMVMGKELLNRHFIKAVLPSEEKKIVTTKILHLPVKAKWYEMQKSGIKTEEYREYKDYWIKRLIDTENHCVKPFTHVLFRYGYTSRCFIRRIDSITIGIGYPEWGAPTGRPVFIIKHHKELHNQIMDINMEDSV